MIAAQTQIMVVCHRLDYVFSSVQIKSGIELEHNVEVLFVIPSM